MSRNVKARETQPVLPPKGKIKAPAPVVADAQGEEIKYAPAKLRTVTLTNVKIYCALHQKEMQQFLSDAADEKLRALGYLPADVCPPPPSAT